MKGRATKGNSMKKSSLAVPPKRSNRSLRSLDAQLLKRGQRYGNIHHHQHHASAGTGGSVNLS